MNDELIAGLARIDQDMESLSKSLKEMYLAAPDMFVTRALMALHQAVSQGQMIETIALLGMHALASRIMEWNLEDELP